MIQELRLLTFFWDDSVLRSLIKKKLTHQWSLQTEHVGTEWCWAFEKLKFEWILKHVSFSDTRSASGRKWSGKRQSTFSSSQFVQWSTSWTLDAQFISSESVARRKDNCLRYVDSNDDIRHWRKSTVADTIIFLYWEIYWMNLSENARSHNSFTQLEFGSICDSERQ